MTTVLVGGSGLIGRALAEALNADGSKVVILSRRPDAVSGLPSGVAVEPWDGSSADELVARLEGARAVVNLAGENIGAGRWTSERKRRIKESRVRVTEAVTAAMLRANRRPATLIQASAVGIYGPSGDETLDESSPEGTDFLAEVCRAWEQASAAVEGAGVRRAVARTGVVLAEDDGALPRMALPFKLFAGGPAGGGRQWLPWIHLRDEVRAIRFLLDSAQASGAFNLTAPNPVRNGEMAKILGRVLNRPSLIPAPAIALKLILGEMSTLVLDGQRALPARLEALGFRFEFPELEPALRDLLG